MSQHIGARIKHFRKLRQLSQEEVELDLNLGFGAMSKIESGKRSPSRETIDKLIRYFGLSTWESMFLLDMKPIGFYQLLDLVGKIHSAPNVDKVVNICVNDICKELKLLGATVCIKERDRVRFTQFTQTWYSQTVTRLIGLIYSDISLSLNADQNFIIQCIKQNKILYTEKCRDFVVPILSAERADLLQKVSSAQSCIILPLRSESDGVTGAAIFSKNYKDDFSFELPVLEYFCAVITKSLQSQAENFLPKT